MQETQVYSLGWEDPLEKEMATPYSMLGEPHGQRNLSGYSPWVCRSQILTRLFFSNSSFDSSFSSHEIIETSIRALLRGASLIAQMVKEFACNAGDLDLTLESQGEGNGNPLKSTWEIPWREEPGGL